MEIMRVGYIGSGSIAHRTAVALERLEEIELYAIASRNKENAQAVAEQFHFTKVYDSYEELIRDPEVDLVYIGLPHPFHKEYAMKCLQQHKPVLVEKPITMNLQDTIELQEAFQKEKVFLCEAFWTRFLPAAEFIKKHLKEGTIGEPRMIDASMCCQSCQCLRMYDPALGGGSMLDIGVYVVNFASMFFGNDPVSVTAAVTPYSTGVDEQECVILQYADGRIANLRSSMNANTDYRGVIYGSKGKILVDAVTNLNRVEVYDAEDHLVDVYQKPKNIVGYEYEFLACRKALAEGALGCSEMPPEETRFIMNICDRVLSNLKHDE